MAKDLIHDPIKDALVNDGWTVTSEHYIVRYEELTIQPDIAAERTLAAQRGLEKIAVEVKSFLGRSTTREVRDALGQYVMYQTYLEELEPDRKVYLGISTRAYHDTFQLKAVQKLVQRFSIMLVVVDIEQKEVVLWTN